MAVLGRYLVRFYAQKLERSRYAGIIILEWDEKGVKTQKLIHLDREFATEAEAIAHVDREALARFKNGSLQ